MTHSSTPDNTYRFCVHEVLAGRLGPDGLRLNQSLQQLQTTFVQGEAGDLTLSYVADDSTLQGANVVAGATLIAMIDYTMAFTVLSQLGHGHSCVTINLSTNMQRAAPPGRYEVRARTSRVGSRVAFVRAELYAAGTTDIIADGIASFAVLAPR